MENITITRMGHYFTPRDTPESGACQAAIVVAVTAPRDGEAYLVSVVGYTHDGVPFTRHGVPVEHHSGEHASFHLSQSCPWHR